MDNKKILELVSKNLEEIKLLVEELQNNEKVDPLLIEITASKAKTLYQELILLSADFKSPAISDEIGEIKYPQHSEVDILTNDLIESEEVTEISISEEINTEVLAEENVIIPESVSDNQQPSAEPSVIEEASPEPVQQSKTVKGKKENIKIEIHEKKVFGEQFTNEPSVYEKLAATAPHESRIKGIPITNIKNAIGLNDRFLYVRELFGNDSNKYETTVEKLDSFNSLLEAIDFLENNFQWTKSEASLKFMDLMKRRFEN
jgi:hypothetical protein